MKILIPIILLVLSGSAFFWFIDPAYQETKGLDHELSLFNDAIDNSKKLKEIRDSVVGEYNAISPADRELLLKFLPNTVDNVRLVRDIDSIAFHHGLTLRNVRVDVGEGTSVVGPSTRTYGVATVSFATHAAYRSFLAFLSDLEQSLRLVDIVTVGFSASDQDLSEYQISIRTYWLK